MQGLKFLLLNQEGKPINHGLIVERITPEKYLCQFERNPPSARVCDLQEIQLWNLFPTDDAMNAFIASVGKDKQTTPQTALPTDGETPPADTTTGVDSKKKTKKKITKRAIKKAIKKVTKKSSRRKSNGK